MTEATAIARSRYATKGFTLIEIMITVVIVGILSAVAIRSYQSYMVKSRRGAAQATLMDIAQREQQFMLATRGYAPDPATLNYSVPTSISQYYNITITASNAAVPPTFMLTATPFGAQASDPTLTIDNTGNKTPSTLW